METIAAIPDIHMWFSIAMILVAIIAYANDRISLEFTSLALISALLLFFHLFPLRSPEGWDIMTTEKLLMGFANPALITVISLLVVGQAIIQTGALNEVANTIMKLTHGNAFLAITTSLIFVAIVSGFLNNTPVVVIFIPIMAAIAKSVGFSVSKVMIPLSFASILGGMTTLIGSSTNLLVSGILLEMRDISLGFFDFTIPGVILASIGLFYVVFILPRLLPDRASLVRSFTGEDDNRQFVAQLEIDYSSDFVGQNIQAGHLQDHEDMAVRMVQRGEHAYLPPFDEDFVIRPRDILVVTASKKDLANFFSRNPENIETHATSNHAFDDVDEDGVKLDVNMAEIVVSPGSRYVGKTLEQIAFHRQYNCVVLGLQRQSKIIRTKLTELKLAAGDVLLVMGRREEVLMIHESRDFMLLEWSTEDIHSGSKARRTAVIFASVVGLAALDVVPIAITSFVGMTAVLLFGCLNMRQAARAMDFKIILLISASLALGTALQETGGAGIIAHAVIDLLDGLSPLYIMAAMFFLMMILTNILSNNAAAVLFTPIAVNLATQLGVDPKMFVFAVVFACNCSFITPIGYQTNLMVMGPGHHKFIDFVRSGIPLALIIWLTYCVYAYFVYNL